MHISVYLKSNKIDKTFVSVKYILRLCTYQMSTYGPILKPLLFLCVRIHVSIYVSMLIQCSYMARNVHDGVYV